MLIDHVFRRACLQPYMTSTAPTPRKGPQEEQSLTEKRLQELEARRANVEAASVPDRNIQVLVVGGGIVVKDIDDSWVLCTLACLDVYASRVQVLSLDDGPLQGHSRLRAFC